MKPTFQRKLCVEFVDNLDIVKQKTSKSKQTLRSLIAFMNERMNIEMRYAQSLHTLAKNGGVSLSNSITEFKNYEEQTVRDALNSVINFTIQESELHKELVTQVKTNIVSVLDEIRRSLSASKRNWMLKLEALRKQIRDAMDVFKREHVKYVQQVNVMDDLKKKKDDMYKKFGLDINTKLQFENMPKEIQKCEQRFQDGLSKFKEVNKATQLQQQYTEKCKVELQKGTQEVLELIEKQELKRLETLKQTLNGFALSVNNLTNQQESLHKLIDTEFQNIDPMKDMQNFISKNSSFTENERLRGLYKEMGLYNPLVDENMAMATGGPNAMGKNGMLVVEKTSRVMAMQLKQMEENRKKQAEEAEANRRKKDHLAKCHQLQQQLEFTKDILHKLANGVLGEGIESPKLEMLYQPRSHAGSTTSDFWLGNKKTTKQLVYVWIKLYKEKESVSQNLDSKLNISQESLEYLEPLIKYIKQKMPSKMDFFQTVRVILDYYKNLETTEKNFFQFKASHKEKEFFRSILGLSWNQIRLVVLRYSKYNLELYELELHKFVDQVELEHHITHQCTGEAIEFTQNATKYAIKLTKRDSFPLLFPLNFMLHQPLVKLYLESPEEGESNGNGKSDQKLLLKSNWKFLYSQLADISENIIGVKPQFQLMHIAKAIYQEYLSKAEDFKDQDENQNLALYSIRVLMQQLLSQFPHFFNQRQISAELISQKDLVGNLDYYSQTSQDSAKILYRLNNSWLMHDVSKELLLMLSNYEDMFGKSYNKLKVMLEFAAVCFSVSLVFQSEGTIEDKLKKDILAKVGEKVTQRIVEQPQYKPPYLLARLGTINEENINTSGKKATMLDLLDLFHKTLTEQNDAYEQVWKTHVEKNHNNVSLDQKPTNPLFFYGQKMATIISEEIAKIADDLDFDKDAHGNVSKLIKGLQKFDDLTGHQTLDALKPKLESYISHKTIAIKEIVQRCVQFDSWDQIQHESEIISESVVDVLYTLEQALDSLLSFVGLKAFGRWAPGIKGLVHDSLADYCELIVKGMDRTSQYRTQDTLPPLNIQKSIHLCIYLTWIIIEQKPMGFAIMKQAPVPKFTPQQFSQQAGMGTKNWVDYSIFNDRQLGLAKVLIRLSNLEFAQDQLVKWKIRYFTAPVTQVQLSQQQQSQSSNNTPNDTNLEVKLGLFKATYDLIENTAQDIINFIATKMTYVDFQDSIFAGIYIGKASEMPTMKKNLANLSNNMKLVFKITPQKYLKDIFATLHQTVIEVLLHYLMMLSSMGAQMNLNVDDFFKNPTILDADIKQLAFYFTPKDAEGNSIGMTTEEAMKNSELISRFCYYMKEDDQMLIGLFKTVDTDVQRNREMISRILFRSTSKEAEKFFEDYKTLFGGGKG